MTQETNSTQPSEAIDATSSQPEVTVQDLDSPTPDAQVSTNQVTVHEDVEKKEPQEAQTQISEDVRKLLTEQKEQIDNLKKGLYDKGREVADIKKAFATVGDAPTSEQTDDVDDAISTLKDRGMITKDDLDMFRRDLKDQEEVNNIVAANPSIDRGLLEDLAKANPEMSPYDIIEKHKQTLLGDAALQRAHYRPVMGEPIAKVADQPVSIPMKSDADFKAFLNDNTNNTLGYL